jgi:hypothetical protein
MSPLLDTDAGDHQDHREVEPEGGELGPLAGVRDPTEDRGPLLDRVGEHDLDEVADLGPLELDVLVGQHLERVVEQLPGDLLGLAELPTVQQRQRRLGQVEPVEQEHQGGDRAQGQADPPEDSVTHSGQIHEGDDDDCEDLAEAEHELPPRTHLLAGTLRHRLHDVGVAVGDVAAERDPDKEPDDDQIPDVLREALREREDDEQDHRQDEHPLASEPVGHHPAEQRADERTALHRGGRQPELRGGRVVLVLDEDQQERDRIEVPRLDEDRGDHHPAATAARHGAGFVEQPDSGLVRQLSKCHLVHIDLRDSGWPGIPDPIIAKTEPRHLFSRQLVT